MNPTDTFHRQSPVEFIESAPLFGKPTSFIEYQKDIFDRTARAFSSGQPGADIANRGWALVKKSFEYHQRPECYSPSFNGCPPVLFMHALKKGLSAAIEYYPLHKNLIAGIIGLVETCCDLEMAITQWAASPDNDGDAWVDFIASKLQEYLDNPSHIFLLFPLGYESCDEQVGHFFLCLLEKKEEEKVKVKIYDSAVTPIGKKVMETKKGHIISLLRLPSCSWEMLADDAHEIAEHLHSTIQAHKIKQDQSLLHTLILNTIGEGKLSVSPPSEGPFSSVMTLSGPMCVPSSFFMFVADFFRMHFTSVDDLSASEVIYHQLIEDVCKGTGLE